MATTRNYTIIGGFLIGALVLLAAAILTFGGTKLFSHSRQAVIFFNQSVLGLSQGSRVLFRGVQIGTVKQVQIRLDPKAGKSHIAVTIEITGDAVMLNGKKRPSNLTIPQLVQRGLRAQLVVYSYVTSQLAVNLDFEPGTQPKFAVDPHQLELPEIPAVPSEIEQLKDQVANLPWKQTLTTVNQTMQSMISLANDLDKTLNQLAPNLEKTTTTTRKTLDAVREAVNANNKELQATIRSMHELTDHANKQLVARNKQLTALLNNAHQISQSLSKLSKNLAAMSNPDSGTRQDIQSTLRDLSASAANLRHFSETIERDPHALLFGGSN